MKGLFVSPLDFIDKKNNGGAMASKRNYNALNDLLKGNVELIMPGTQTEVGEKIHYYESALGRNKIQELICARSINQIYTNLSLKKIINYINNNDFDVVWFDAYCCGEIIKKTKINGLKVLFMQNIETQLAWDLWDKKKFWNILKYNAVKCLEKKAVKYADKIITLNMRDANLLERKFSKTSDFIFPITIEDKFKDDISALQPSDSTRNYMLFVGSYYKPNIDAVRWLQNYVMDNVDLQLVVVGKNMERIREKFQSEKVRIVGTVDDITDYYRNALLVIEPIFTGGGMKVKTAEALMYGKNIIGTREAFEGYDKIEEIEGIFMCDNPEEFIFAINSISNEKRIYNQDVRECFENKYVMERYLPGLSEVCIGENKENIN